MAVPTDDGLDRLLREFVCVRLVQMWGVDLSRFQFDNELTWAVFFLNADGTIYGRYGTRSALGKGSDKDMSVAGFEKTLAGALALHEQYLRDKASVGAALAAKTPPPPEWRTPESIPALRELAGVTKRFEGERGKHGRCIHCHHIPANRVMSLRAAGKRVPDRAVFPYPVPDEIGMHMDPAEMATVQTVVPASIAAAAGLEAGDRILRLDGQPILSTADIQWVLHLAADEDSVTASIDRGGERRAVEIALPDGWRRKTGAWRYNNLLILRSMFGLGIKELTAAQARARGVKPDQIPLWITHVARRDPRMRGIRARRGDLVVAIDGDRRRRTLGDLARWALDHKPAGSTLDLTLRRGDREWTIALEAR